jgi:acyl transferase domain-containing protein
MTKQNALVVCPGRGTYNKEELGYFSRHHGAQHALIEQFDALRERCGQTTLSQLDSVERYSINTHTRGDNASALIHACAYADFLAIDRDHYDIVAITGNSMGWYIALACAGVLSQTGGFDVVNTMGRLMQESLIGGQILYPFVDEDWVEIPGKQAELLALTETIPNLFVSIKLGGMIVFAGDDAALKILEDTLQPVQERFPIRLFNHAGFHSPLQQTVSEKGRNSLPVSLFKAPEIPLIDGRGHTWLPFSTAPSALHDYTLGQQVTSTYDFTAAVQAGMHEFAPDVVIVLGPGKTLGGAIAQSLIVDSWLDIDNKAGFIERQKSAPVLYAMGIEQQRNTVTCAN